MVTMKKDRRHLFVIVPLVVVLGAISIPMTIYHLSGLLLPTPSTPVNVYGEFPFRIVYEINDERFTVEDVFICEYMGRNRESFTGRDLQWVERLATGNKTNSGVMMYLLGAGTEWKYARSISLLDCVSSSNGTIGKILLDIGGAPYYLGYYVLDGYTPGIVFHSSDGILDEDILFEKYNIRIIETEFSEPLAGNGIDMTPKQR